MKTIMVIASLITPAAVGRATPARRLLSPCATSLSAITSSGGRGVAGMPIAQPITMARMFSFDRSGSAHRLGGGRGQA